MIISMYDELVNILLLECNKNLYQLYGSNKP